MDYIIDFYKNLDSINLLLFWGVIIVIILLLVFSIIMVNKNKDLKNIIAKTQKEKNKDYQPEDTNDIPIANDNYRLKHEVKEEVEIKNIETPEPVQTKKVEEPSFVAEEHVISYNKTVRSNPMPELPKPIKEPAPAKEITAANIPVRSIQEETIPTRSKPVVVEPPLATRQAYQKNVLREMSLNQTSPIGIVRRENQATLEQKKAEELQHNLNSETNSSFNDVVKRTTDNREYLTEVSEKLRSAARDNGIERTEYEIKQEEEAIISYEELMQKKDSIQMVDEEEAVISIDELLNKKRDKLYNITEKETDNNFIDELKHFRGEL